MADPMIIMLIVAAVISALTSMAQGEADFADVIIICFVVVVNAVLGVVQESKAEEALAALQEMSAAQSKVVRDGEVSNLKDISSLALRIVCEHIGLGSDIAPQLFSADGRFLSTLILSPPGGGKTTLLRDLIRVLSLGDAEHRALRVAVIDERCELAVCCKGRAQMELGNHTDVLSLCPKAVGIPMVLRGMNPQVIAVDEITAEEDIRAMCLAANCGVGLLASIHAASVDELHQKPLWRELLRARVFCRCIVIRSNGGARSYEVGDLPCSD